LTHACQSPLPASLLNRHRPTRPLPPPPPPSTTQLLASSVLNPHHIDVSLDDIGGLESVKRDMRLRVLRPLREHDAVSALLWRPVKGVLLYGPPGTGKTMLAKAMAREVRAGGRRGGGRWRPAGAPRGREDGRPF
jgi:Cdc6-like AAA superfamily ATPase